MNRIKLILCVISVFSYSLNAQDIMYVDPLASGTGDGSSWENAYTSLEDAVNNAADGSELWLANKGAYYISESEVQTTGFVISQNIKIYGGFEGTETSADQRVPGTKSTISGEIGDATSDDNSYNAFIFQAEAWVDAISFSGFNSDFQNLTYYGVICADSGSTVSLKNVDFTENSGNANGVCVSAHKNSMVNAENLLVGDNISNGSLITRNDNAVVKVSNSTFDTNGDEPGFGNVFYSGKNLEPIVNLNEMVLLDISGCTFRDNNMSLVFSYFGSVKISDCEIKAAASGAFPINVSGESASLELDHCLINGVYGESFFYVNGINKFSFTNSTISNPTGYESLFFSLSGCDQVYIENSLFENLSGQVVFQSASQTGHVAIKDSRFENGSSSGFYLYIQAQKLSFENSSYDGIVSQQGNYFVADTVYLNRSNFEASSGYSLLPLDFASVAMLDSCQFIDLSQGMPLFRTREGAFLTVKNSKVFSAVSNSANPGIAFLLSNQGGSVDMVNNSLDQISGLGHLVSNTGELSVFGNEFQNLACDSAVFMNSGNLELVNSNFADLDVPLCKNDSLYNSDSTIHFDLLNSVVISEVENMLKDNGKPGQVEATIRYCFSNIELAGENNQFNSSASYSDLYLSLAHPDLAEKGMDLSGIMEVPEFDLAGNDRVFKKLDIGAFEFQQVVTSVTAPESIFLSSCYPNPGNDFVNLNLKESASLKIMKPDGVLLSTSDLKSGINRISVRDLDQGVYIFVVNGDNMGQESLKFVKN